MGVIIILIITFLIFFGVKINFHKGGIMKPPISNSILTEGKTKSGNKNITVIDKTECVPPPAGSRRSATMYLHVVEDSHRWTDIKQMLEWLKYKHETVDKQYLKIGLENTLDNGYNLINLKELIEQNPNDAELGKAIRKLNG